MRIWDIDLKHICNAHLQNMHNDCHLVWSVLTKSDKVFKHHEEIVRWQGKLKTLFDRHQEVAEELICRGMNHNDAEWDLTLDESLAIGNEPVKTHKSKDYQLGLLLMAQCPCPLGGHNE